MNVRTVFLLSFLLFLFVSTTSNTIAQQKTYCNPINIDYGFCPIPNFVEQGKHRATADPVITVFKGNYYLFTLLTNGAIGGVLIWLNGILYPESF